jgi:drug/metabolite transporter (DMT)-like permease
VPPPRLSARTALTAALALLGFAANSILCRAALGGRTIDAFSFTALRIGSGAAVLLLLVTMVPGGARGRRLVRGEGGLLSAVALFAYAAAFSLAYLRLQAGVGALVLFVCVQATMIAAGIRGGERPTRVEWIGLAVALTGLAVLTYPGSNVPDVPGLLLMAVAGASWGVYSLRGRGSRAPLAGTADNFVLAAPLALGMLGIGAGVSTLHVQTRGVVLALASGGLASGLGYSLWYGALLGLGTVRAAVVQLSVPVIAATGAILFLGESMTRRLAVAGALILGGVGTAVLARSRSRTA